jgi:hypothetical protein
MTEEIRSFLYSMIGFENVLLDAIHEDSILVLHTS